MADACRSCGATDQGASALGEFVEHTFDELARLSRSPSALEILEAFDRGARLVLRQEFMAALGEDDPASWRAFRRSPFHFVMSRPGRAAMLADLCVRAARPG